MKIKKTLKKRREKKRRIKAPPHPPHPPPPPDQLRNYEAGHTYGGLKTNKKLQSIMIKEYTV